MEMQPNSLKKWTKNTSKKLLGTIVYLGASILIGVMIVQYMTWLGIDVKTWFRETRMAWFAWRVALYVAILSLMYIIDKRVGLADSTKWLLVGVIIVSEGVNLLHLLIEGA